MPLCARHSAGIARRGPLSYVLVGGILLCVATLAAAGFKVSSVQPRAVGKTLHISGSLDLTLTPKVEEALGKGIPIELAIDMRLYRQRPLIWDAKLDSWTIRRELRFHALSGQYLIGGVSAVPADRESFTALNEALTDMGSLDDLTLPLSAPLATDADYRLDVRVALDIEALPALLRPVAYTSRAWDLNSGWTTWTVRR